MRLFLEIGVLALLILLNAGFSLGEMALVSSRRAALSLLERKGVRGAARARELADDPQRFLPTVQVGITLIGILTGVFGGARLSAALTPVLQSFPALQPFASTISLLLTVLGITFLTLVFGELVPKQLALRHPETLAAGIAPVLAIITVIVAPAVWLLNHSSTLVLRAFGTAAGDRRAMSEEELKAMLAEGTESGVLEHEERDMIERVLRLADKPVRAIMTPRTEIAWIDRTAPRGAIIAALRAAPHSRFIVCDRVIDNVVGVVQAKDILDRVLDGKDLSLASALRQPLAIPDTATALDALERLKSDPIGLALVLDEYGSFEGMITASDLLEAIVGDPEDAANEPALLGADPADSVLLMDGLMPVDEVKSRLDLPDLPAEGSYHTLAGLILALLRRLPHQGDAIAFGGWRLEVMAMDGRRVERVRVSRETGPDPER
ncbi:MAG: hemolysin C [Rhodospirillales bacterium 20-60-12]|nr:MAG: hemolysin C [Rhodospirillales bacterium 20-60-12]HQT67023.1 hemolysin family protein [Acetobacteraceae bacterium]